MRLPITAALLTLAACSRTTEGPTPQVSQATNPRQPTTHPARVCNAQGDTRGWRIELAGSSFAPMPLDTLTDTPKVGMPTVTIQGAQSTVLARESVFFESAEKLLLDVPTKNSTPAVELPPGSYAVEVKNPTGTSATLADALQVVPPPTLTSVTAPEGFNATAPSQLVITGTGFQVDAVPQLVLRKAGAADVALVSTSVVSATQINAAIPAGTPEGTYDLVITNPEGCGFTLPNAITITYARLGTLTVEPAFGWQNRNTAISLYNRPNTANKELQFAGGSPEVFILAPLKANPTVTVEIPLRRAAFVVSDDPTYSIVTAVVPTCSGNEALPITAADCPTGIIPGGPYALKVLDTNGAVGQVAAAKGFTVLANEPPVISGLAPSSIDTGGGTVKVQGAHFDATAKVQLVQQLASGNLLVCDLATTRQAATADKELQATVPGSVPSTSCKDYNPRTNVYQNTGTGLALAPGLLVVRVQNGGDAAFANYSGLILTNPSTKPLAGKVYGAQLAKARADFPLVTATDDLGQPFMYALGGNGGSDANPALLDSVEVAQVTLFGDVSGIKDATGKRVFRTLERTPLTSARRGHNAVVRTLPGDTSYIYVLGGRAVASGSATGASLATVERAQVLKVADAPSLQPPESLNQQGSTLPAGTLYYRVSALLADTDAKNPGGETLPSDEYPVKASSGLNATRLSWQCIAGAVKYRVYRSPTPNLPSGSEQLLEEITAPACTGTPLPQVAYVDDGSKSPAADAPAPLPPGALGRWKALGDLRTPRANAAARIVGDSVYVVGGCNTTGAECTGAAILNTVERAGFVPDLSGTTPQETPDLGAFGTLTATLTQARQRHSLAVADVSGAPNSFSSGTNDSDAYLLAAGGDAGSTSPFTTNVFEVSQVKNASGTLATPANFTSANYSINGGLHGGWVEVAANGLFVAGTSGTGVTFRSGVACPTNNNQPTQCTGTGSFANTLPSTALSYQDGGPRYLSGNTLFRAFVYVAGGLPGDNSSSGPVSSVESILY